MLGAEDGVKNANRHALTTKIIGGQRQLDKTTPQTETLQQSAPIIRIYMSP
jgi:hypothetical protein